MSGLVFWMSGLYSGCLDLYFGCAEAWTDGRTDGWTSAQGGASRRTDGQTDGRTDKQADAIKNVFVFQKLGWQQQRDDFVAATILEKDPRFPSDRRTEPLGSCTCRGSVGRTLAARGKFAEITSHSGPFRGAHYFIKEKE